MTAGHYNIREEARENLEKAIAINIEIANRNGESSCYVNLGTLFRSLRQYDKAREFLKKALAIKIEIGHRDGEASCYENLEILFHSFFLSTHSLSI